jgi:hypothetical protein
VPVRTARLALADSGTGVVKTIYTVPGGKTAIVKDVRINSASGPATRCVILGQSGATSVAIFDRALEADQTASVQGFMVLEPGDRIAVFAEGASVSVWASGSELEGVAP